MHLQELGKKGKETLQHLILLHEMKLEKGSKGQEIEENGAAIFK